MRPATHPSLRSLPVVQVRVVRRGSVLAVELGLREGEERERDHRGGVSEFFRPVRRGAASKTVDHKKASQLCIHTLAAACWRPRAAASA